MQRVFFGIISAHFSVYLHAGEADESKLPATDLLLIRQVSGLCAAAAALVSLYKRISFISL